MYTRIQAVKDGFKDGWRDMGGQRSGVEGSGGSE